MATRDERFKVNTLPTSTDEMNVIGGKSSTTATPTARITPDMVASMPIEEIREALREAGMDPDKPAPSKECLLRHAASVQILDECPDAAELTEAIYCRHAEQTRTILAQQSKADWLYPSRKNAALLHLSAQYLEVDPSHLPEVENGLECSPASPVTSDTTHIEMARGLVEMHRERYNKAIAHFGYAMIIADNIGAADLSADSRYNLGRSYWKKGHYRTALKYTCSAKMLYKDLNRPKRIAAIEILEAWLLFMLGKFKSSKKLLEQAEGELIKTGDHIDRGNVLSFHGRLEKQEERYKPALRYFWAAIAEYRKQNSTHRNVARTQINIASVYRHVAINLEKGLVPPEEEPKIKKKVKALRNRAIRYLEKAERIYENARERNQRGIGKIHIYRALLDFEEGSPDHAREGAGKACQIGEAKGDDILISKAKRIQCHTADDATVALKLAQEAVSYAKKTDSRRDQARAYICWGNLLKNEDIKAARKCAAKADRLLTRVERAQSDWKIPLDDLQGLSEMIC